jgi:hypothetical protein
VQTFCPCNYLVQTLWLIESDVSCFLLNEYYGANSRATRFGNDKRSSRKSKMNDCKDFVISSLFDCRGKIYCNMRMLISCGIFSVQLCRNLLSYGICRIC